MKRAFSPWRLIAFGFSAVLSIIQKWSLAEFCWSIWLTGLVVAWAFSITAAGQIVLTARHQLVRAEKILPMLKRIHPAAGSAVISLAAVIMAGIALRIYSYMFAFYGFFLSVFAEMEPRLLFGRNEFINSDFITPVTYLAINFWPLILGALIAETAEMVRGDPWQRVFLPLQSEIVRMHLMVLLLPFVTLLAWAFFKTEYQPITVVFLLALFFFMPRHHHAGQGHTDKPHHHIGPAGPTISQS